jgi:orotidine-5'-phosphate decarboxylase
VDIAERARQRAHTNRQENMTDTSSLCIALDGSDRSWILSTARSLADHAGWFKIGLEAFIAHGPDLVHEVAEVGPQVFLDLKLHDIPATVRRAAANCASSGAAMFTVHAGGGRSMLEAAVEGASDGARAAVPRVLAVTVLTSLDRAALEELGFEREADQLVVSWARLAQRSGLAGVVASAREAAAVRRECGDRLCIVTPGIRPDSSEADDQRRVLTPTEAIRAGANILVVGRPVTRANDPIEAARRIIEEISAAR